MITLQTKQKVLNKEFSEMEDAKKKVGLVCLLS